MAQNAPSSVSVHLSLEPLGRMRTKAVIFDVDGTLIDTNGLHSAAWVEAFQHFGVKVDPDDVRRQMGKGGDQLMPSFLASGSDRAKGPRDRALPG